MSLQALQSHRLFECVETHPCRFSLVLTSESGVDRNKTVAVNPNMCIYRANKCNQSFLHYIFSFLVTLQDTELICVEQTRNALPAEYSQVLLPSKYHQAIQDFQARYRCLDKSTKIEGKDIDYFKNRRNLTDCA